MSIWVDAQLSPAIAKFIIGEFGIEALAVRDLGLRDAKDHEIFAAAKAASAIVMSKDRDFCYLLEQLGPPPKIIWVTCGNTSNVHLCELLRGTLLDAVKLLETGESLVELF